VQPQNYKDEMAKVTEKVTSKMSAISDGGMFCIESHSIQCALKDRVPACGVIEMM